MYGLYYAEIRTIVLFFFVIAVIDSGERAAARGHSNLPSGFPIAITFTEVSFVENFGVVVDAGVFFPRR